MEYLSGQFKEEPDADLGSWLLAIQSAAHNCQMPLSRALLHTLAALFAMRIGHGGSVATKRGAFLRRLHLFLNGSTLPPGYLVTTTSTPDTPDLCKVGSLNTVCHKKYLRWATTYLQRLQDPDPKQLMADWMVTTALLCRKNTIAGIMASLKAPTSPGSTTLDQKQILKALLRVGPIYLKLARRHDASYAAALSALLIQAQHRNADVPTAPTFGL